MEAEKIIETWEEDGIDREWFAVDQYLNGTERRVFVGSEEQARHAVERRMFEPEDDGYGIAVPQGTFGTDDVAFWRMVTIPASEAKEFFLRVIGEPTYVSRAEAIEMMGVSKSRISQLVKKGIIRETGEGLLYADIKKQIAVRHAGPKRTINVWNGGEQRTYVVSSAEGWGEAEFIRFWVDEIGDQVSAFLWPDGSVATTDDWQGQQPATYEEAAEYSTGDSPLYRWMLCTEDGFEDCIWFRGLPRSAKL